MTKLILAAVLVVQTFASAALPAYDVHSCAAVLATATPAEGPSLVVSTEDLRSELGTFRKVLESKIDRIGFVRTSRILAETKDRKSRTRLNLRNDSVAEFESNLAAMVRANEALERAIADVKTLPEELVPVRQVVVGRDGILDHLERVSETAAEFDREHPVASGPVLMPGPSRLEVVGRTVATTLVTIFGAALIHRTGLELHAGHYWWASFFGFWTGGVVLGGLPRVFSGTYLTVKNALRYRAGPVQIQPRLIKREVDRAAALIESEVRYATPETVVWQNFDVDFAMPGLADVGAGVRKFPRPTQLIGANETFGNVRPADPRRLRWDRIFYYSAARADYVLVEFLREPRYAHDLN